MARAKFKVRISTLFHPSCSTSVSFIDAWHIHVTVNTPLVDRELVVVPCCAKPLGDPSAALRVFTPSKLVLSAIINQVPVTEEEMLENADR
jgi:hypothetical protein